MIIFTDTKNIWLKKLIYLIVNSNLQLRIYGYFIFKIQRTINVFTLI